MESNPEPAPPNSQGDAKVLFAWLCVALLFVSLVVPIAQAPIIGTINVFGLQDGTAYWFLGFAIVAALLTFVKRYQFLAAPGVLILGATLYYIYNFDKMKQQMLSSVGDNMFSGLLTAAAGSVQLQWGISLLLVSGVALIVASLLEYDAPTLPILFARNRKQFIRAGACLVVILLGVAIAPSTLPHAKAAAPSQAATNPFENLGNSHPTPASSEVPSVDPKVLAMKQAASVGILTKSFHNKDIYNGDYDDDFVVTTQYHNLSKKMITGIKGSLVFTDQFGERITGFNVEFQKNLGAGAIHEEEEWYKYNQFEQKDEKLKSLPLARLKVTWNPKIINFADGSSIHASSE